VPREGRLVKIGKQYIEPFNWKKDVTMQSSVQVYEMRFQALTKNGKSLSFPCNAHGQVPMDELSAKLLMSYLFARAVVGCQYAAPLVFSCEGVVC
jgi:hypothetical protein